MSLKPCGTDAAYRRHLAHGEQPCTACRAANTRAGRDYRDHPRNTQPHPCGTEAAYRRHLARGEPTCRACCDAHARYQRAYTQRRTKRTTAA